MKNSFMKKNLANMITMVRILLSPILFLSNEFDSRFVSVYLVCAASDLFDGVVARMTNSTGTLGAVLDTIGDVLMYASMMKVMIVSKKVPFWAMIWLLTTMVLHFISAMIPVFRFGKLYFTHSASGKLLGAVMFLVPFAFMLGTGLEHMTMTCATSTYSSIEAIMIQSRTEEANADIWSWGKLKQHISNRKEVLIEKETDL